MFITNICGNLDIIINIELIQDIIIRTVPKSKTGIYFMRITLKRKREIFFEWNFKTRERAEEELKRIAIALGRANLLYCVRQKG